MPATIRIVNMYTKTSDCGGIVVNTTSKAADDWQRDLSPFHLGPCDLYDGHESQNMENAWQYSKVYAKHAEDRKPTEEYWEWAKEGWDNPRAVRYPMGRGARPLYSLWQGEELGYIDARKKIYAPLYAEAVQRTQGWNRLKGLYENEKLIVLRDYDGYYYASRNETLTDVLNNPSKKMGHAFVLAMLLHEDDSLSQVDLRQVT